MKKFSAGLLMFASVLILNTSCHKSWQCECKRNGIVVDVVTIHDVGKMGAKDACDGYQTQNNYNGDHQTCDLK